MNQTQWYIGAPNGVILCVEKIRDKRMEGVFYHSYDKCAVPFSNMDQMLFELDQFYDSIDFPQRTLRERSFRAEGKETANQRRVAEKIKQERLKVMSDEQLLSKHGDLGTFIIKVQHRQNSSWQGRITWMEKNKTLYFRSIWEMIKLIASALDTVSAQEEEPSIPSWGD